MAPFVISTNDYIIEFLIVNDNLVNLRSPKDYTYLEKSVPRCRNYNRLKGIGIYGRGDFIAKKIQTKLVVHRKLLAYLRLHL